MCIEWYGTEKKGVMAAANKVKEAKYEKGSITPCTSNHASKSSHPLGESRWVADITHTPPLRTAGTPDWQTARTRVSHTESETHTRQPTRLDTAYSRYL